MYRVLIFFLLLSRFCEILLFFFECEMRVKRGGELLGERRIGWESGVVGSKVMWFFGFLYGMY